MEIKITIPSPGESIHKVTIANWLVQDGSFVEKDTEIAELESDKATLTLTADQAGVIKILIPQGQTAEVGAVACIIDTEATHTSATTPVQEKKVESTPEESKNHAQNPKITPVAKKMIEEKGINITDIKSIDQERITSETIKHLSLKPVVRQSQDFQRTERKQELTPLRKKLSERLMQAKNETAMLTTFNEVDMTAINKIRQQFKEHFFEKHQIKLGFMSFFSKAATIALQEFPVVNSRLDGDTLTSFDYVDLGVAVQTEKGLVVPVIRNTESKNIAQIEEEIFMLAEKARNKRISIPELEGGTFSITNGGVFGSLLATPLLNYPQTAILGMHTIQQRPVALNGEVVIRPMMYIALSYDHRVLDGRDSILFLKRIKEFIENPQLMVNNLTIEKFLDI